MNNDKVLSMPSVLSEETIKEKALERLEREYNDFLSYSGTQTFDKLLGIYKPNTKSIKKENPKKGESPYEFEEEKVEDESYIFNKNLQSHGQYIADGVNDSVYKLLRHFIKENTYFAATFLKAKGSYTGCLAYAIHGFMPEDNSKRGNYCCLSDYEVYKEAICYYFSGADVVFNMEIINPEGLDNIYVTEEDISVDPDYTYKLHLAELELEAKKKAEEERKAKAKKAEEERKLKEKKRLEREARKKRAEELKKAQQSIFADDTSSDKANDGSQPLPKPAEIKVTPKSSKKSLFAFEAEDNDDSKKDRDSEKTESIQISLF